MKKIIVLLGLFCSTSVFAQQTSKPLPTVQTTFKSELFDISTPENDRMFFLVMYTSTTTSTTATEAPTVLRVFSQEKYPVELTQAFYFRNGKVLFSLGKKFNVVSKPLTDPQRDFLLQSYVSNE